jgi:hypothetical protein
MTGQGTEEADGNSYVQEITAAEGRLQDALETVVAAVIERAQEGDIAAAKLVVDRLLPAPRDRRISFALTTISCNEDPIKASADVLMAVAQGQITLTEAIAVEKLLRSYIATNAVREFERRLAAVESVLETH